MGTVEVGQRVVRSPTWTWRDQDGGDGHLGTVVKLKDQDPQEPIPTGWAKVRWDNGYGNNYQVGSSGSYDLVLFDSAPAGVIQAGAVCDSCLMRPIAGIRWKCNDQSCPDYDLCTPCYMNDRHDLTHTFIRFTSRKDTGTQVTPRFGEAKTVSRGLCPGAEVRRGKDWQGDDEDGDGGTVVEICPFSERPRSGVTVCWTQSKQVTTHRVGFDGKMDLKYTRAGTGIGYYATHLPVLDARPYGSGHTEIVKPLPPLLETEASSSSDSDSGEGGEESQLINAASRGNVVRVVEILSTSPEKANAKIDGKTALHSAAYKGHLEVVQALLESGAEIDITDEDGDTPLLYSVQGDEPAITKYLIGKGADINRGNDHGIRAIHRAAYAGFVDCARVLINHGCDVNVQETEKLTPLHVAIIESRVDVVEQLVKVPDLDVTLAANKGKVTALQLAAGLGKPEPAELIAQSFPRSIVAARDDGQTILHIGAAYEHVEVMKVVLAVKDHGLDVNAKDVQGRTALHVAAFGRQSHIIEFLVSHGADINLQNLDDHTALHILASTGAKDLSDINDTPTLRKIRHRFRDCGVDNSAAAALCYMVLKGASIDIENVQCRTPLYYIKNAELKKTLKKIAREKIDGDMASWEEPGEDSTENESGADFPAGNQQKIGKPEIESKEVGLKVGDLVAITLDSETLQIMQQMGGQEWLPEMGNLYGKVAKVTGINLSGNAEVTYPERKEQPFTFNPDVLNKVPRLGKGDRVQISNDLTFVRNVQESSRNGWSDGMEKCLGMEGTVMNVDSRYDSRVRLIGVEKMWLWHPCSLILVKKNSSDDDEQSAESTDVKLDGSGQIELLEALLSLLRTDPGKGDGSRQTEMLEALLSLLGTDSGEGDGSGQAEMLKALLSLLKTKAGSLLDSDSDEGGEESQLIKAAKRGNVERVVEILSISPEKANAKIGGKTALHGAAVQGHLEVVQALLESGAEIEITDDDGNTPLHYSVGGDEPAITNYLIGKGADINRGSHNGRRAIHEAAARGFVDCARVLINHGCDVNVQDTEGDTPLHDAITKSKVDVVELLVKVPDLDVTLANKRKCTALQYAALRDNPESAELIAQSCPRSIVVAWDDGHTVLHIGAVNGHVEVMKVIMSVKDHGLDVNARNVQGDTALHLAAHKGQSHSIEFLVSQGADINLRGKDGYTALHLLVGTAELRPSSIKDTPTLRKIRERFRDCGVVNNAAAALCYMVLNGASIDIDNVQCRTPLFCIRDAELKKTLKKIAREKIPDDMPSQEDLGEDEDVSTGRLSNNSISVDNDDIIVKQNDGLSGTDKGSPNLIRQDSVEKETCKPDIEDEIGQIEILKALLSIFKTEADSLSDNDSGEENEESKLMKAAERDNVKRVMEMLSTSPEKIRKHFRDRGGDINAAAALCHMVLNGTPIDLENYIRDAELKKIARENISDDMSSCEDFGEDEDVKKGRLSSNAISDDDDDDIIIERNDDLSGTDKGSPRRKRQDSAESESGADCQTDVASKTINSRGGTIHLRNHGISLCIPVSALQKDCKITLKVLPHPSNILFTDDEAIVSPGVVFEPSGTTFERPLKLVIPHCAVLTDPSKAKVTMHFTHEDTEVTKEELSSTGTPSCVVQKDVLEVYINHFSICEMFMVISDYFIGKRVASTPYLPISMSRLEPQYCHLRLYNDTPGLENYIETEEKNLDYRKMAPTKTMFVIWNRGELNIKCEVERGHVTENERTVSLDDIRRLDRNVVSFLVEATGDADVYVKFNFHPHCDEGHAFNAKFSDGDITSNIQRRSTITPVEQMGVTLSSKAASSASQESKYGAQIGSERQPAIATRLDDKLLYDIAEEIENDQHLDRLMQALEVTQGSQSRYHELNRLEGRLTTRGSQQMLLNWRAETAVTEQQGRLKDALTTARLLDLRDRFFPGKK